MSTIELTDEQARELRAVLNYECDYLDGEIRNAERKGDGDLAMFVQEKACVLSILTLLENAT
jgi:hypothetical protein